MFHSVAVIGAGAWGTALASVAARSRREVASVAAEVDPAENDFAEAGFGEAANFGDNGLWRQAAGFSADGRDYAEGAAGVAAVLNFQGGAGVIPFPKIGRAHV